MSVLTAWYECAGCGKRHQLDTSGFPTALEFIDAGPADGAPGWARVAWLEPKGWKPEDARWKTPWYNARHFCESPECQEQARHFEAQKRTKGFTVALSEGYVSLVEQLASAPR